ncbi:hypothetical protein JVU11DRAFT_10690 [Chiua virens]|nr:hypothetical protein JVU11DRAFT_10690 [Chiua virens]
MPDPNENIIENSSAFNENGLENVDEGIRDAPFRHALLPQQLQTSDACSQDELHAALYSSESMDDNFAARFFNMPVKTTKLSSLRNIAQRKDKRTAYALLRSRRVLKLDEEFILDHNGPDTVPRIGPHFWDFSLIVGHSIGLHAALPVTCADATWHCELNFNRPYTLWPTADVPYLPFDPTGRMMYIGTRRQENMWLALVPKTYTDPDHLDNVSGRYPRLNASTTALARKHSLMIIMFFAWAFHKLRLQDIHCETKYPEPLTQESLSLSTEILRRLGDNSSRVITLRLLDLRHLQHVMINHWNDWVAQAPQAWKNDGWLTSVIPICVTIRYGQNQHLALSQQTNDAERNVWQNDHDYTNIRQITFAIATHISWTDVKSWEPRSVNDIITLRPILYNAPDDDPERSAVDLHTLDLLDEDNYEINVYDANGFRVPRRTPSNDSETCGALLNLREAYQLFTPSDVVNAVDDPSPSFSPYPQAFLKDVGNLQSSSIPFKFQEFLSRINNQITPQNILPRIAEDDLSDDDIPRVAPVLRGHGCQIYNVLSHRVRDAAKFHPVQLGMVTAALSGSKTLSYAAANRWRQRTDSCDHHLPYDRYVAKVADDNQPDALRFENVYTVDVQRMRPEHRNGRSIYDLILLPLTRGWLHPSVLTAIKPCIVVIKSNIIPRIYEWTSYPIACLIDHFWTAWKGHIEDELPVPPFVIESVAMLERTLNFAHTGNAQVLCRGLMGPAFLSLGIVNDGFPCISDNFICHGSMAMGKLVVVIDGWPVDKKTRRPLTASRRVQQLTFGNTYYEAYEARFTIMVGIHQIPEDFYRHVLNPTMRRACYAADIAMRTYIGDVKNLIQRSVMEELKPALTSEDPETRQLANDRLTGLQCWEDQQYPLSLSRTAVSSLMRALIPHDRATVEITRSDLGRQSLSFFVNRILSQCADPSPRRKPPCIAGGNFRAVMMAAIEEIKKIASRSRVPAADVEKFIKQAIGQTCIEHKIGHIPWTANVGGNNQVTTIVHNVWLVIDSIPPPNSSLAAPYLAPQASFQARAQRSSETMILNDPAGEWSALDVRLTSFYNVLHKTAPPLELSLSNVITNQKDNDLTRQAYSYAINAFNGALPLHQLALIAGIVFAGLTPSVYVDDKNKSAAPSDLNRLALFVKSLRWACKPNKKGSKDKVLFVVMVTVFVISYLDPNSPIRIALNMDSDTRGISAWLEKHRSKGITLLALCRLGLARPLTACILSSARWKRDVIAINNDQINALHHDIVTYIRNNAMYGCYDAIVWWLGHQTAEILCSNGFLTKRQGIPTPTASEIVGRKHALDD